MKQKIDNGVTGSPGRFPRPRICQYTDCHAEAVGYKWCAEHAVIVQREQKRDKERRRRQRYTALRKALVHERQDEALLEAMRHMPPVHKAFDIQHAPIEKSLKMLDAILSGDAGMVR